MMRYQLYITLESDLCVSDGGVYNSYLDTDICYDSYGFPYIPARRIKGCLRECGLELIDWGVNWGKDISVNTLFGDEGSDYNRAKVRIGDALLKNYKKCVEQAEENAGNRIFHPQNVLNHYSYIRTQTGIDYETGVADPTTLRTIRVAKKGLEFVSDIEMEEKYFDAMHDCCETFTNLGVGRTRGLGEISTSLEVAKKENFGCDNDQESLIHVEYEPGAVELQYRLTLKEPLICKSTDGGESKSLDYIDGGKTLGLIANEINKKGDMEFIDFMNQGELFCSNAYIEKGDERCLEVPASYFSIKNDDKRYLEKRDPQIPETYKNLQLNEMKHCYIRENKANGLVCENVEIEERYHHRRPEDKAIGRAVKDEELGDSHFYEISSIKANQVFRGYVRGSERQIKEVYDCLNQLSTIYLGYSHSSEYGKTQIQIVHLKAKRSEESKTVTDFAIKLESPALIYNDHAFYSTNPEDLDKEIRATLKFSGGNDPYCYVNYITLGGYNVTWNRRKPMVEAFDKGTILYYHLDQPTEIKVPDPFLIGERISEGLGEISFIKIDEPPEVDNMMWKPGNIASGAGKYDTEKVKVDVSDGELLAKELCEDLFLQYVRAQAVKDVNNISDENNLKREEARPTISNMLSICQENMSQKETEKNRKFFDLIKDNVNARYGKKSDTEDEKKSGRKSEKKNEKLKFADMILKKAEKNCNYLIDSFENEYEVKGFSCDESKYESVYLKTFLEQLKYAIRILADSQNSDGEV